MTDPAYRYDPTRLVSGLAKLSAGACATFAAACAERMLPIYRWVHQRTGRGDPVALESALAAVWADLTGSDTIELEAHQFVVEELVPYEDESWVDECAFAQHAAAAVAYAIRCRLSSDPHEAEWAARQIYEALDLWVTSRDDADVNAVGVEDRILSDPLVQAELARQERDMKALREALDGETAALFSQIRDAARADASTVFGTSM